MSEYRKLTLEEAERIAELDATHFVKNVWRINEETGEYGLVEINWTDTELPNGFDWHLNRFKETVKNGGTAQAKEYGAEKLFLCAGSAENTRDIQLEYVLE